MSSRISKLFWNRSTIGSHAHCRPAPRRISFEPLEDRRVLATLWVDPNVAPGGNIFSKINDAVAAVHSGDTIKVVAGTYNESMNVGKAGLKIIGSQVRVSGEPVGPSIVNGVFSLNASNITIKNFTIQKSLIGVFVPSSSFSGFNIIHNKFLDDSAGVLLNTSLTTPVKTTISGNIFTNDGGGGISQDSILSPLGMRNVIISDNLFTSNNADAAIKINGTNQSTSVQILNNRITGDAGIAIANAKNFKINGNAIVDPKTDGIALAGAITNSQVANNSLIQSVSTVHNAIRLNEALVAQPNAGNKIFGNAISGVVPAINAFDTGIFLAGANGNAISKNTATRCGTGVDIEGGASNSVSSNVLAGNVRGILAVGTATSMISKNVVNCNTSAGIRLENLLSGNLVTQNTANFNGGSGIELDNSDQNKLTGNSANFNVGSGFVLNSATKTALSGNTANQNQQDGFILLGNSQGNTLAGNAARSNFSDGFRTTASASANTFMKNTAANNLSEGFFILTDGNTLTMNTAVGNGADGIVLKASDMNIVKGNMMFSNRFHGLLIQDNSSHNMILSNVIKDNDGDGIVVSDSTSDTISANLVLNNAGSGIIIDFNSSSNSINGNTAMGNGDFASNSFDLQDSSSGGGTDGTANTWAGNKALTRSPSGLP